METAPTDPKKSKRADNNYLRYSGLGVQLLVSIGVVGWIGHQLDLHFKFRFPGCLLLLVMLAFAGNMILLYRTANKD